MDFVLSSKTNILLMHVHYLNIFKKIALLHLSGSLAEVILFNSNETANKEVEEFMVESVLMRKLVWIEKR